jgi:hypothetical protein
MWSGLSYFLVSRDTIRQHMVSAQWSDRRVPVYMEKSEHSLDISFAIFDPCEVFNPMKMPRQSPLQ